MHSARKAIVLLNIENIIGLQSIYYIKEGHMYSGINERDVGGIGMEWITLALDHSTITIIFLLLCLILFNFGSIIWFIVICTVLYFLGLWLL